MEMAFAINKLHGKKEYMEGKNGKVDYTMKGFFSWNHLLNKYMDMNP